MRLSSLAFDYSAVVKKKSMTDGMKFSLSIIPESVGSGVS